MSTPAPKSAATASKKRSAASTAAAAAVEPVSVAPAAKVAKTKSTAAAKVATKTSSKAATNKVTVVTVPPAPAVVAGDAAAVVQEKKAFGGGSSQNKPNRFKSGEPMAYLNIVQYWKQLQVDQNGAKFKAAKIEDLKKELRDAGDQAKADPTNVDLVNKYNELQQQLQKETENYDRYVRNNALHIQRRADVLAQIEAASQLLSSEKSADTANNPLLVALLTSLLVKVPSKAKPKKPIDATNAVANGADADADAANEPVDMDASSDTEDGLQAEDDDDAAPTAAADEPVRLF